MLENCTPAYAKAHSIGAANRWQSAELPRGPAAVLAALHLRAPQPDALASLTEAEWREAVAFADKSLLTFALRRNMRDRFPQWLRDRTDRDAANNLRRMQNAEELYRALDCRLRSAGIEYVALKGLTQWPAYGMPAELRVQYDVDLFVPRGAVHRAAQEVLALGFESLPDEGVPTDHLPGFIRKTGWEWRGDYFDPEMPLAVELHFQLWNERVERLPIADVEGFWERRTARRMAGIAIPVLAPPDALAYTALHLLRHVLRGSARPYHIYELAGFLEGHASDDAFWREWRGLHSPDFRKLQAVMFRLAAEWFGCELGAVVEDEVAQLRPATKRWFEEFALSPAIAMFRPRKDELWLHLTLLNSWRDKLRAARLRLLPINVPGPIEVNSPRSLGARRRYLKYVASRACHHAAALPYALGAAFRWLR